MKEQNGEINYSDLNNTQQAILYGMSTEDDKKIISIGTLSGTVFMGIGKMDKQYDSDEISAEIIELEKMDILRVDGYSTKSNKPIYKPTSLGIRMIKELGNGKKNV
jgi:hypothetical protein